MGDPFDTLNKKYQASIVSRKMGLLQVSSGSEELIANYLCDKFTKKEPVKMAFANTNLVALAHKQPEVKKALDSFFIINDGVGLEIASRLINKGKGFPANLNGTDFTPFFLKKLPSETKVFLYGAKPEVAKKATKVFEESSDIKIVGTQDGFTRITNEELCEKIKKSGAEILLVGTANPRQELWIERYADRSGVIISIGVGALFDFTIGLFHRAPLWVRKIRMEWFYRLIQEPRRLAKRYTIDIIYFIWVCLRCKNKK